MKLLKPGDVLYAPFQTRNSSRQIATADSTPVAHMIRNGAIDGAVTLTVSNLYTGFYVVTGTIPTTYAQADSVIVQWSATVGGTPDGGHALDTILNVQMDAIESLQEQNTDDIAQVAVNMLSVTAETNSTRQMVTTGVPISEAGLSAILDTFKTDDAFTKLLGFLASTGGRTTLVAGVETLEFVAPDGRTVRVVVNQTTRQRTISIL